MIHPGAVRATLAVAFVLAAAAVPVAQAATLQVTSEAESGPGTLSQAILEAEPGDTVEIPAGEYTLFYGDVLEAKDLTLRGAGEDATTVIPSGGGEALEDPGVSVLELTVGDPLKPDDENAGGGGVDTRAQIIALIVTFAIFLFVLELVRRRRLVERYAIVWMSAAFALLVLSIWTDGLNEIAELMGIQEPANAIFILAFGVGFLLLLNFSVASSRLSEETKILAQEVARLEQELREAQRTSGDVPGGSSQEPEHERPVGAEHRPEDG